MIDGITTTANAVIAIQVRFISYLKEFQTDTRAADGWRRKSFDYGFRLKNGRGDVVLPEVQAPSYWRS